MPIQECKISEILSAENSDLIAEYSKESAIKGMPEPNAQFEMYKKLEASGSLRCYGAYKDSVLIGFVSILISVLPHYGVPVAIVESIFVNVDNRKSGAGFGLLKQAERYAKENNTVGLLLSTPIDGAFYKMMKHCKTYTPTNQVFFKKFKNE